MLTFIQRIRIKTTLVNIYFHNTDLNYIAEFWSSPMNKTTITENNYQRLIKTLLKNPKIA